MREYGGIMGRGHEPSDQPRDDDARKAFDEGAKGCGETPMAPPPDRIRPGD